MPLGSDGGAVHPWSLRFVDDGLERQYQVAAGAESLVGLRVAAVASAVQWVIGIVIVPLATPVPPDIVTPACVVIAAFSALVAIASMWTRTLNAQHAVLASVLSVNGLGLLYLASMGGILPGYGLTAVMLPFAYAFLARTRFIHGVLTLIVIGLGFAFAAANWRGESVVGDAYLFLAAAFGALVALRIIEASGRRVFHQAREIAEQQRALELEKAKSDRLLLNVMPASVSNRLRDGATVIADEYPAVTILFSDIVGFTGLAARLTPGEVIRFLSELYTGFDELATERGLEKIKTVGDSYMAAGGLPEPLIDHAARVVDMGLAMIDVAARPASGRPAVRLRIGVHSGPAVGGVIGTSKFAFDVWGDTVNVASRLESQGQPDRVHISDATWEAVRHRFDCETQGTLDLRGRGRMTTYLVVGHHPPR
jgi:class 3 adenylate cyclase